MSSQVGSVGYTCAILLSATDGVGPHMWDLLLSSMKPSVFQKILAGQLLYPPVMLLVKLSLFLLYLRVFAVFRHIRILIFIGIAFHLILYTTSFVLEFVFCYPRRGQSFLMSFTAPSCAGDATKLGIAQGVANIIGDFYLLLTPVPVIWKLQLSFQKKVGVTAIFMTGFLGCVTTILGLYYRVLALRSTDPTWILIPNYITSALEINVGIMCSCMPSLPSFFRQLDSKLLRFPSFTRILSRLTRRTRRSDSTPGGAVSVRSKRSGSRTPGLKAPVREGTQFGKMFRNGNREPAVWAECAGHAGNWHAERQQSYEFTAGERGYGRVGNPFTRLRWEDWKGGPTSKLLAQIVVTE
ncbi:hypothetical protein LPUS_09197 [Lasallia pustulata]|uniref:Rhodopsin domain-containing protein n=1 Tax=Lasallia pustulata TaxID=136370 RepID=A0A1W5D6T3_9LECA|nr:hypothetical protein LPUS_09197 [Lasallia pustulata]